MSCEEFSGFKIEILFKAISVKNYVPLEKDEHQVELSFLGEKVEAIQENESFIIQSGCLVVDARFTLLNNFDGDVSNEDFTFTSLGDPLIVNLTKLTDNKAPDVRKSMKKLKGGKQDNTTVASGSINLLQNLQEFLYKDEIFFQLSLTPTTEQIFEICAQYQVNFFNPPVVYSRLAVEVSQLHYWPNEDLETLVFALHFPTDDATYKTVFMQKVQIRNSEPVDAFLLDNVLKDAHFEVQLEPLNVCYQYENILSSNSFDFFSEMTISNGSLLLEIRSKQQLFMSLIKLQIFNHDGVQDVKFLAPLYHANKKKVLEMFHQDLCAFRDVEKFDKSKTTKRSSKTIKDDDQEDSELVPFIVEENQVALMVNVKISKPLTPEKTLEDLKLILNQHFPFIEEISVKEAIVSKCEQDFEEIIVHISNRMENIIDESPELDAFSIQEKVQLMIKKGELFNKVQMKEILRNLIGNKLNVDKRTETNHEFKITMIDAFNELSQDMMKVLCTHKISALCEKPAPMPREMRKIQTEEWLLMSQHGKAEEILQQALECEKKSDILMEYSIFLMRVGKFQECEKKVLQLLKTDNDSFISLYLLAYLMRQSGRSDMATITMEILTKLQPNMEFWVVLMMLYREANNNSGVDYCELKIQGMAFIKQSEECTSLIHPELNTEDELANIIMHQLNLGLTQFVGLTRDFMSISSRNFQNPFDEFLLNVTEMMIKERFEDALNLIGTMQINGENEMTLRLMLGNVLYATGSTWSAICEYEIAYNMHLKAKAKFPQLPTIRCGNWFLNDEKSLQKARRYFHHCCKLAPTFNALMGLGTVCYEEMNYREARKYFEEANKINETSAVNWLYLAMSCMRLNQKLDFEKCFHKAQQFKIENLKVLEEAEQLLDL